MLRMVSCIRVAAVKEVASDSTEVTANRIPDGLTVGYESKRGVQDNSNDFGLSNWKDGAAVF